MKKTILSFVGFLMLFNCNDEAYDTDSESSNNTTTIDFSPSGINAYWIYDVESNSLDALEMNFTAIDSIYVDSGDVNSFQLNANNDGVANGSMNLLLTNGSISKTPTTLVYDGSIEVPQNLLNLGFTQDLTIEAMTLLNLNASNSEEMFVQESNFSEIIEITETVVPVDVSSRVSTKKIDFYNNKIINGTDYADVFEAEFILNIEIIGSFSVAGFTQLVPILEGQDIMKINYFYANTIGLVHAETNQGISLSPQFTALLDFLSIPLDFPANVSIEGVEKMSDYSIE